jgi:glycosyltransferase involved in cell wall biosynthesis
MKIALVNVTKPISGTGDGVTEYTYQLYEKLKRSPGVDVDCFYAIEETRRNNLTGLLYTQTLFKQKAIQLAHKDYDIIHITNQEAGFVSKILRKNGSRAKIVTTIHDTMRLRNDLHRGVLQKTYNKLVSGSVADAMKYSDFLIFYESGTLQNAKKLFKFQKYENIALGIRDDLIQKKIPAKRASKKFVIGYLGSFAFSKNVMLILKAANELKSNNRYVFNIYGTGEERDNLLRYKIENELGNVNFLGFAPESRKRQIYDSFDVFVFPALGAPHNFPPLEAMARGVPVIVSKQGEYIPEIRKVCIPAKDETDLARIIMSLDQKGYPNRLKRSAMAYAHSISWSETTRKTLNVYRNLLD